MRIFAGRGQLASLSVEARVLYTAFAVFCLVGYGSSLWLYADGIGFTRQSAARWYRGEPAPAAEPEPTNVGPAIEVPPEEAAPPPTAIAVEKPARQVVETFHFHLFTMPVVLLIIGHLFMLARLPSALKLTVIVVSSAATLAHLVSPLLVRFVAPGFTMLLAASGLLMAAGWTVMTLWPVVEMWRPKPKPLQRPNAGLDHVHEPRAK